MYITCHRLPETINEAFFFSQCLVLFVRFTEVVATVPCEYFAKVSIYTILLPETEKGAM